MRILPRKKPLEVCGICNRTFKQTGRKTAVSKRSLCSEECRAEAHREVMRANYARRRAE